jgi:hypothetical protein
MNYEHGVLEGSLEDTSTMPVSVVHRRLKLHIITLPTSNILCLRELVQFWFPVRQYLKPKKELIEEHMIKNVTNKRRREYFD